MAPRGGGCGPAPAGARSRSSTASPDAAAQLTVALAQEVHSVCSGDSQDSGRWCGHTPSRKELLMLSIIRKTAVTVGVIGAAGFGGATIADAASSNTSTSTTKTAHSQVALSSDAAAKVKAAALAKVPGATVLRTEAGGPD